jgi:serine/threonine protein kinase
MRARNQIWFSNYAPLISARGGGLYHYLPDSGLVSRVLVVVLECKDDLPCMNRGSFAVVHLAVDRRNGRQMACKVIKKKVIFQQEIQEKIHLEVLMLTKMQHVRMSAVRPSATRLIDLIYCSQIYRAFVTPVTMESIGFLCSNCKICILDQHIRARTKTAYNSCTGGDLHAYIARKIKLSGDEALFLTYQLLQALDVSIPLLSRSKS